MNSFQVLLFAQIRESAGNDTITVDLPAGATVTDLRDILAALLPNAASLIRQSMIAVDESYVAGEFVLPPSAEIACIPPVSGG